MARVANFGGQSFELLRKQEAMYIDKTKFIRDWWEKEDRITVLSRPPRYGKSLNIDTLRCFFSNEFEGRKDLFEGLYVWHYDKYRKLQGTYPVVFLNLEEIIAEGADAMKAELKMIISDMYDNYCDAVTSDKLSEEEKDFSNSVGYKMEDSVLIESLRALTVFLSKFYDKKAVVLVDSYDLPLLTLEKNEDREEMTTFLNKLFSALLKDNQYLERALIMGLTSDMAEDIFDIEKDNIRVIASSNEEYKDAFGFSKEEILAAMSDVKLD